MPSSNVRSTVGENFFTGFGSSKLQKLAEQYERSEVTRPMFVFCFLSIYFCATLTKHGRAEAGIANYNRLRGDAVDKNSLLHQNEVLREKLAHLQKEREELLLAQAVERKSFAKERKKYGRQKKEAAVLKLVAGQLKSNQSSMKDSAFKIENTLFITRNLKNLTIADFKIIKVLGRGALGIVFLCEVFINKQPFHVALKMIVNKHHETAALRGNYENEYLILYKIREIHENIIRILCDFTAQPTSDMLEYVGEDLRQDLFKTNVQTGEKIARTTQFFVIEFHPTTLYMTLKRLGQSIKFAKILKYSKQFLDCLIFLFDNRVVHRDVKLDNILISASDSVVLSDFGESVETDDQHCCLKRELRSGNQQFTAPEVLNQLFGSKDDDRVDFTKQYSWDAGCLLFQIAWGEFPFDGYPIGFGRPGKVAVPPLVVAENPKIPPEFVEVIVNLLINDPLQRMSIQDAKVILSAINPN